MEGGSHPPSEPKPQRPRAGESASIDLGSVGRPARVQMIAALLLGLVLVAIPLYLWRRPRSLPEQTTDDAGTTADAAVDAGAPSDLPSVKPVDPNAVSVGVAHPVDCRDGTKKTAGADCDRLPPIEKALAFAIESAGTCVPSSAGGGTIEYVADVNFARKKLPIALLTPKDTRSIKSAKAVGVCAAAVKRAFATPPLDFPHAHGRYKIAIVATYPLPH